MGGASIWGVHHSKALRACIRAHSYQTTGVPGCCASRVDRIRGCVCGGAADADRCVAFPKLVWGVAAAGDVLAKGPVACDGVKAKLVERLFKYIPERYKDTYPLALCTRVDTFLQNDDLTSDEGGSCALKLSLGIAIYVI